MCSPGIPTGIRVTSFHELFPIIRIWFSLFAECTIFVSKEIAPAIMKDPGLRVPGRQAGTELGLPTGTFAL